MMNRIERALPFILALFLSFALPHLLGIGLAINNTDSVMPGEGIYLSLPFKIKEGSLVAFSLPFTPKTFGTDAKTVLKRVKKIDESGAVFLEGDDEAAFDSRYYGALGKKFSLMRYVPLITVKKM